jgi:hypothetical protein
VATKSDTITTYLNALDKMWSTGVSREHSHRPALLKLLEAELPDFTIVNEPAQIECGAPDFIVLKNNIPRGHLEAKDLGAALDIAIESEQITRYRAGLPNLLVTNYVDFIWFVDGQEQRRVSIAKKGKGKGALVRDDKSYGALHALILEFSSTMTEQIKTAAELAGRLASTAILIRSSVSLRLKLKTKSVLRDQLEYFRRILSLNMTPEEFADIYAQTITYGLFTARCYHKAPEPFTRQFAAYDLPRSNPFLRSIYAQLAGPEIEPSLIWAVDHVTDVLNHADIDKIMDEFASLSGRRDPVFYFYENFLEHYDPTLKEKRGVYYTPSPVVDYIVRSVHSLLVSTFNLKLGLADRSKTSLQFDDGSKVNTHRVIVLDPAAGTGTFLASAIELIENVEIENGRGGSWKAYVREHLLPRIFGLELMMAPYTVCHLKLGLILTKSGFEFGEGERVGVYLTNSLEEPQALLETSPFLKALGEEGVAAGYVKRIAPVMVVLGNPPYSGHSANSGEFLARLLRGYDTVFGEDAQSYFHIDGVSIGERQPKWLNDDYVKFVRFSQWKIERAGCGILAFITNHNYLSAPTFRAMRASLLDTFDDIYILNLNGSTKRKDKAEDGTIDQNVFDIQQGVAIALYVKRGKTPDDYVKRVKYYSLRGPRTAQTGSNVQGKYKWLDDHSIENTQWHVVEPVAPYYLFVPRDKELDAEYSKGISLKDLVLVSGVGIVAGRDHFNFAFDEQQLEDRLVEFAGLSVEDARSTFELGKDSTAWSVLKAQEDVKNNGRLDELIQPVLYRPFDKRFTYYTGHSHGFLARPTNNVSQHMVLGENIALCSARSVEVASGWRHILAVDSMVQHHAVSTKEVNHLFPLWTYGVTLGSISRHSNLSPIATKAFSNQLKIPFETGVRAKSGVFGELDVFYFSLAILHSDEYRQRYAEPLRDDYARIPVPSVPELFWSLASIGEEIAALQTSFAGPEVASTFPAQGSNFVSRRDFAADSHGWVWINDEQYFTGVDEAIEAHSVGGIRVLHQWLSDRRGTALSTDNVETFRGIISAISRLADIPSEIDECIDLHGGWPIL